MPSSLWESRGSIQGRPQKCGEMERLNHSTVRAPACRFSGHECSETTETWSFPNHDTRLARPGPRLLVRPFKGPASAPGSVPAPLPPGNRIPPSPRGKARASLAVRSLGLRCFARVSVQRGDPRGLEGAIAAGLAVLATFSMARTRRRSEALGL